MQAGVDTPAHASTSCLSRSAERPANHEPNQPTALQVAVVVATAAATRWTAYAAKVSLAAC